MRGRHSMPSNRSGLRAVALLALFGALMPVHPGWAQPSPAEVQAIRAACSSAFCAACLRLRLRPTRRPTQQQIGAIRAACRSDFISHCSGVQPGEAPKRCNVSSAARPRCRHAAALHWPPSRRMRRRAPRPRRAAAGFAARRELHHASAASARRARDPAACASRKRAVSAAAFRRAAAASSPALHGMPRSSPRNAAPRWPRRGINRARLAATRARGW